MTGYSEISSAHGIKGSKLNLEKSSIPVILSNKYAKYLSAIKLFDFAV